MKTTITKDLTIITEYSSLEEFTRLVDTVSNEYNGLVNSSFRHQILRPDCFALKNLDYIDYEEQYANIADLYNKIMKELTALGDLSDVLRFKKVRGVQGEEVIVPNLLKGIPTSMVSLKRQHAKSKVIDIVIDITSSCAGCNILSHNYWPANSRDYTVSMLLSFAFSQILEKRGWQCAIKYVYTKVNKSHPIPDGSGDYSVLTKTIESLESDLASLRWDNAPTLNKMGLNFSRLFKQAQKGGSEQKLRDFFNFRGKSKLNISELQRDSLFIDAFKIATGCTQEQYREFFDNLDKNLGFGACFDFNLLEKGLLDIKISNSTGYTMACILSKLISNHDWNTSFSNVGVDLLPERNSSGDWPVESPEFCHQIWDLNRALNDAFINYFKSLFFSGSNFKPAVNTASRELVKKLQNTKTLNFYFDLQKGYTWEKFTNSLKNLTDYLFISKIRNRLNRDVFSSQNKEYSMFFDYINTLLGQLRVRPILNSSLDNKVRELFLYNLNPCSKASMQDMFKNLLVFYASYNHSGFNMLKEENFKPISDSISRTSGNYYAFYRPILINELITVKSSTSKLSFKKICDLVIATPNIVSNINWLHYLNPFTKTILDFNLSDCADSISKRFAGKVFGSSDWFYRDRYDDIAYRNNFPGRKGTSLRDWGRQYSLVDLAKRENILKTVVENNMILLSNIVDTIKFARNNPEDSKLDVIRLSDLNDENEKFIKQLIDNCIPKVIKNGDLLWKKN